MRKMRRALKFRRLGISGTILFLFVSFGGFFSPAAVSAGPAVREGEKAPLFEIQGFNSQKLGGKKNLLLVFYRGFF